MRVISGTRKGHKLKTPKNNNIRPTEDRIKESLFNIIGRIETDAIVLDAFGGTGSMGIEFLSRGAKESYFVDLSKDSIGLIKDNLSHTRFLDSAKVIRGDIFNIIKELSQEAIRFNYIYLDPPFRQEGLIEKILEEASLYNILEDRGSIFIEHEKEFKVNEDIRNYIIYDYRKYGSKAITFLKKN